MLDIYLITLFMLHMLIWIFCFFGGFFSLKFVKIITLIFLPVNYLIHLLPYHIFVKEKINKINKNIEYYTNKNEEKMRKITKEELDIYNGNFLKNFSQDISKERKDLIVKIYICEENSYIFPKMLRNIRKIFNNTYFNPLSAQGMIILSYIINIYLLKFKYKTL